MFKKVSFSILALLLFLLTVEVATRLLEISLISGSDDIANNRGWQTEFFGKYFDWHQSDPDLLWRFKPNLANRLIKTNSDGLLADEIAKEKRAETKRILILGDSSPVGLGLESREYAFDAILKYILEMDYLGKYNIEILNAAVSGYTSEQIVRFLEIKGWEYQPDFVILYCGNNDASVSGYYSDREVIESQKLKGPRKFLSEFAFYRFLKNILLGENDPNRSADALFMPRVTPEQFKENLVDIAGQCRDHGCPLVIMKPAVPYLWPAGLQFKIFAHITGEDGKLIFPEPIADIVGRKLKYCFDEERFEKLYGNGDIFTKSVYQSAYDDSMAGQEAIDYYSELLESDNNNHLLYNNLGVSFWLNGQYREADFSLKSARALFRSDFGESRNIAIQAAGSPYLYNIGINQLSLSGDGIAGLYDSGSIAYQYLDSALQADYFSLRIKDDYWKIIDDMINHKSVMVIDLPEIFRENGGEKLFIDHCHPTIKGHYIIAEELSKVIRSKL